MRAAYGAGVIGNLEAIKSVADKFESDLIVLPSSIHELLLVPYGSISLAEANEMVREVNANEVAPEEQLSDHAYIFRRETRKYEW